MSSRSQDLPAHHAPAPKSRRLSVFCVDVLHELGSNPPFALTGLQAVSVPRRREDLAADGACRFNEKQSTITPGSWYKLHSVSIRPLHLINHEAFLAFFGVCESAVFFNVCESARYSTLDEQNTQLASCTANEACSSGTENERKHSVQVTTK